MGRMLLSWSDRGVAGPRPAHQSARPREDRGPILRLVDHSPPYESALILTTLAGRELALQLAEDLRAHIPKVELRTVDVRDPSDFSELFAALQPIVQHLRETQDLDILLSSGTPQMQTLWLIYVKAGLLAARMLQVIPAAFIPKLHAHAVREVNLDVEGFPEIRALRDELVRLRAHSRILGEHIVGTSAPMRELANRLLRVAPSNLPVLISGETGTGKELIARSIHDASHRASGPLITENCGALSESVLSSELFGHEKGAFTGAAHRKRGLFEVAHGGTLFLDEVGELSPRVQVNLLRVLQDGTLRRLGSEESVRVDVRIVAATHRDLFSMVREGTFREDLYYRLHGATLHVPALRERISDLEALVAHFLGEVDSTLRITRDAWEKLEAYRWPGNVRELRAEVLRWNVFCDRWVRCEDLDEKFDGSLATLAPRQEPTSEALPLAQVVAAAERRAVADALAREDGNVSRAARSLQIDRNTLKRKIAKLGIPHVALASGRPADPTFLG